MNAILLSIGDELISGLTLNTNAPWLAEQLATLGVQTIAHVSVGDQLTAIINAIHSACDQLDAELDPTAKCAFLIITGGLGPTEDDLTRQALADALNQQLVEDPDAMLQVERFFKSINRPMASSNRLQAMRPHEATIIENSAGTAPGLHAVKNHTHIFVMPGVPREMKQMVSRSVLPAMREIFQDLNITSSVTQVAKINTFGLGESNLGEKIKDLMVRAKATGLESRSLSEVSTSVGTTVHDGIVSVRIYATGAPDRTQQAIATLRAEIGNRLGALIFSESDESLEASVAALLLKSGQTAATAESCTGGMLAELLTNTPGSSAYFLRGWVTYSNAAKHDDLGVPVDLIEANGAVSEATVRAMAQGARQRAGADFALAITGIAGPDGGTSEKPVGTVWIALASPAGIDARRFIFPGSRAQVRLRSAQMALALLRWKLLGVPMPI